MKGYGERLSPSPIYYIIVIVKKDQLCAAQVIFVIHSNAEPKPHIIWPPTYPGEEGEGAGWGGGPPALHNPHQKIEVDSKFCFKMSLF